MTMATGTTIINNYTIIIMGHAN